MATRQGIAACIIEIENPLVVTFTEICESAFDAIADAYGELVEADGTAAYVQISASENGCPSGGGRGNAYLATGSGVLGSAFAHHLEPTGSDSEDRVAVCGKVVSTGTTWTACAAHFASSPALAERQADLAWDWWFDVHTTPWVFGGDFNQVWAYDGSPPVGDSNTTAATARWAFVFQEVHLRAPVNPASLPTTINTGTPRKIDYMFAADSHFDQGTLVTFCNSYPDYSDHRYCRGRFNV